MPKPRAITAEEERKAFLAAVRNLAKYWATNERGGTVAERCDGVAFSILGLIDGINCGSPGFTLAISVHEDDEASCKENGENWHKNGLVINDTDDYLHDAYYKST